MGYLLLLMNFQQLSLLRVKFITCVELSFVPNHWPQLRKHWTDQVHNQHNFEGINLMNLISRY